MNPSTPPKGSLEDLFRHHLLESEAAAVPPRAQVWEQVDNRLLLAQNEKYRRRLVAYRWAMAASLLLASLAGGGWWRSQQGAAPAGTLAQATTQPGGQPELATTRSAQLAGSGAAPATAPLSPAAAVATATRSLSSTNPSAIDQTATLSASALIARAHARAAQPAATFYYAKRASHAQAETSPVGSSVGFGSVPLAAGEPASATESAARLATLADSQGASSHSASRPAHEAPAELLPATTAAASQTLALAEARSVASEAALATRRASLATLTAGLPPRLPEVAVAPGPPLELARRWQYGLAYSASAYQPNIDWVKPVTAYNLALGFTSASLTRSAAAEYRENLRPGLGQRLSLWATRRLGNGRWSLRTGLEVAQNTATSASSVAFVGEQVADLNYTQASQHRLQRTSYRYRSVSVPAELRYGNPAKTGFSFYGRVGAFVSALLNVRSEVDGTPEAGRTYTLQSGSTPYRPYSGGLRGGAGMQYRPAGHQWSLNFGPVAELGILSLNADPSQDFWGQQRPYSFGLEAGMELGRGFKIQ
ncbi:outer membrane beta-barrel protein [Hymenobacter cheonanensis]|uniref:outer membrane beta-barrel protein n=1 Tax=Hymenobacter sp. CA2-7 TaxID=3063993 RepID=UPI00271288B4|nr:outer membrane beta-barrel protein [Hymenobacter sp. CA2-7]MDO7885014.1 outer membrane beta-barrel protein [Hymenobacter sp. CA2-7]